MKITDERYTWLNKRRQFDQYGRMEVGARVEFQRMIYAPTNNPAKLRTCMRLETGEIVDVDPTVTIETQHTIIDIRESETGAFLFLVDDDGLLSVHTSNAYGQAGWGFFRVLRYAPQQREIAA